MKQTTINRFREWAHGKDDSEVFSAGTDSWTKADFEAAFLGGKPKKAAKQLNIDVKVNEDADVERTFDPGHIEESGD
jgi:hypothetical protein